MRTLRPAFVVLFAALTVSGCSGGNDLSRDGGTFTLVTNLLFAQNGGGSGRFTTTRGAEALGCSGGTFVNRYDLIDVGVIQQDLTCTDGERSGSFTIRLHPTFSSWTFESGTNDYTGLKGKGAFSLDRNGGDVSVVAIVRGRVRF